MSDNIFEKATRQQIRFETNKGSLTVEDLWHLPLLSDTRVNLNAIAQMAHKALKQTVDQVSFVDATTDRANDLLQLKFDIVKYIIDVKVLERDAAALATKRRDQKQELLALIADKEKDELKGKSLDDLRKMAEAL